MLTGVCFPDSLTRGFAKGKSARLITGTVTDQKGAYSIPVNADNAVLVFSFIGHKTQEVSVGNKSIVDVMLVENNEVLNEVVVTALGMGQKWIASWTNADPSLVRLPPDGFARSGNGVCGQTKSVAPSFLLCARRVEPEQNQFGNGYRKTGIDR